MNIIKSITKNSIDERDNTIEKEIDILNKKYFCLEEVGRGGLGIVYKGLDIYSEYFKKDSKIVIKIPTEKLLEKEDISAFVYAEYRFLRELSMDNIVKVLDFNIDEKTNIPYLVLEYIDGELLSDISIANMDLKTRNYIFKSLVKTLEYIHSKNIIHGDISPSNIIIKENNTPVIFDFGISQKIEEKDEIVLEYQNVKAFNPKYSAPELLSDTKKQPNVASDIFSLATILYEVYTNQPLFYESSNELDSFPINKRDLSSIPFLLRKWFINALSLDCNDRKLNKQKSLFFMF